jgi:uncharacterized membrane protein HdeD (DUF308 family)
MPTGMPSAMPDTTALRKHSTWFIVYGIIMIVLGVLAILAPLVASLTLAIFIGWLLLIGGVFGIIAAFSAGTSMPGFWWHVITAVLYALAGVVLLWNPIAGVLTLTVIFTAYLVAGGVMRIILAFSYRPQVPGAWGWMLLSGIVDLALAAVILINWPVSGLTILGLIAGINLVMMGVSIVAAAAGFRRMIAHAA